MEVCGCNAGCLLETGNLDLKRNYCASSKRVTVASWYWVCYGGQKQWAKKDETPNAYRPWSIVDCEVGIHDDAKVTVLKGPYTEEEIEQAYFGYWV